MQQNRAFCETQQADENMKLQPALFFPSVQISVKFSLSLHHYNLIGCLMAVEFDLCALVFEFTCCSEVENASLKSNLYV